MPRVPAVGLCADPEAADFVFGHSAKIKVVGLDVTHSCTFTGSELKGLHGKGRFGTFLSSITAFYLKYHQYAIHNISLIWLPASMFNQLSSHPSLEAQQFCQLNLPIVMCTYPVRYTAMASCMASQPW